jgi:hypothetical protein
MNTLFCKKTLCALIVLSLSLPLRSFALGGFIGDVVDGVGDFVEDVVPNELLSPYNLFETVYQNMPTEIRDIMPTEIRDTDSMRRFLRSAIPSEIGDLLPEEFWQMSPYLVVGGAFWAFLDNGFFTKNLTGSVKFDLSDLTSDTVIPFGGKSTSVIVCGCTANFLVTLQDYSTNTPIQLIYQPFFTRVNREYQITTPGVYLLGSYYQGTSAYCQVYVPPASCVQTGTPLGTITNYPHAGVGTSKAPSL